MTRHTPIAEMAVAVLGSSDPFKAVAMLKAYFDDSGTHAGSLITAIGGYVAPEAVWTAIEVEWSELLADYDRYGVSWYHAADVSAWQNEWAAVPLDSCRDAPRRFGNVIGKHNPLPVWAAVVNEDFHRYATPEYLAAYPTPFMLCFHEAMGQLYHQLRGSGAPRVAPFAAHGDYAQSMLMAHERYLRDGDFSQYVAAISFDDPRRCIPLQCADLVANQYFNYWREMEYPTGPLKWMSRPVLAAATPGSNIGACYSGKGMLSAVERFMRKNAD